MRRPSAYAACGAHAPIQAHQCLSKRTSAYRSAQVPIQYPLQTTSTVCGSRGTPINAMDFFTAARRAAAAVVPLSPTSSPPPPAMTHTATPHAALGAPTSGTGAGPHAALPSSTVTHHHFAPNTGSTATPAPAPAPATSDATATPFRFQRPPTAGLSLAASPTPYVSLAAARPATLFANAAAPMGGGGPAAAFAFRPSTGALAGPVRPPAIGASPFMPQGAGNGTSGFFQPAPAAGAAAGSGPVRSATHTPSQRDNHGARPHDARRGGVDGAQRRAATTPGKHTSQHHNCDHRNGDCRITDVANRPRRRDRCSSRGPARSCQHDLDGVGAWTTGLWRACGLAVWPAGSCAELVANPGSKTGHKQCAEPERAWRGRRSAPARRRGRPQARAQSRCCDTTKPCRARRRRSPNARHQPDGH